MMVIVFVNAFKLWSVLASIIVMYDVVRIFKDRFLQGNLESRNLLLVLLSMSSFSAALFIGGIGFLGVVSAKVTMNWIIAIVWFLFGISGWSLTIRFKNAKPEFMLFLALVSLVCCLTAAAMVL